jgi:hypothetical protein
VPCRRAQPDEKPESVIYCAGLSFVGSRELADTEHGQLSRRCNRLLIDCFAWLVVVPFLVPVSLGICLRVFVRSMDAFGAALAVLGILTLFIGLPVGLLRARDIARRRRMLKRTIEIGSVRCFEGQFNDDDWTDLTRQAVKRTGLAHWDGLNRLELLASSDVLYRLNKSEPRKWTPVELTAAAPAPVSPARFAMPRDWEGASESIEMTRRRLTEEERRELSSYARRVRKNRWIYAVPVFFFARIIAVFSSKLASSEVRTGVAITLGVAAFGYLFFRSTREASRWEFDAQYGWLGVVQPAEDHDLHTADAKIRPPMEVLPGSGAVWTIGNKPAGWRRHHS